MPRRTVLVGVLALAVPVIMVGTAPAALACSCVTQQFTGQVDRADVVFSGRVLALEPERPRTVVGSTDPMTWTFSVDRRYKGDAQAPQPVVSVRSEASCGVEFREGRTYLVLGSHQQAGGTLNLASTLCNGTRELAAVPAADLAVLGPGQAPPPVVAPTPATEPAGDGAGVRIAAGLGVLVAAALVGVAVRRRRRAR
ncbi:MAG: hypothetical protein QOJ30_144 [Pseudonocardiales bacterium]|jgi:hypothetical protein|nr:hypothetical protein [Pseudonocardiales bacterium]HEV7469615.1 hypothetical protein [Pseudonocardia sp.]